MRVLSWDVGLRTLSYCVLNWEDAKWTIEQWDTIDVQLDTDTTVSTGARATGGKSMAKRKKVSTVSVEYAAQLVMDTLHRRAHLFPTVDAIIVEQQPAGGHNRHSNVRMKVVSHVIQCYFYTRGIVLDSVPEPTSTSTSTSAPVPKPVITFVSPASKLVDMERAPRNKKAAVVEDKADEGVDADGDGDGDGDGDPDDFEEPKAPAKTTRQYTSNKKFAIQKTQELLGTAFPTQTDMTTFFNASNVGKKDDLADSFLLGYYYILKKTTPKKSASRKKRAIDACSEVAAQTGDADADANADVVRPVAPKKRRSKKATAEPVTATVSLVDA
jgi:hypothetical protein